SPLPRARPASGSSRRASPRPAGSSCRGRAPPETASHSRRSPRAARSCPVRPSPKGRNRFAGARRWIGAWPSAHDTELKLKSRRVYRRIGMDIARWTLFALAHAALWLAIPARAQDAQPGLLVFAAASLTNVLEEVSAGYTRETGQGVKCSYAASSALARQIE